VKFDRETITAELAAAECKRCGHIGAGMTFAFMDGPHFARLDCKGCGGFIEWVSMPDVPPKRERRKSRKKLDDLALMGTDRPPCSSLLSITFVLELVAEFEAQV